MTKKLILASAGAGKTQIIINEAVARAEDDQMVLILTYTDNNQKEIRQRICQKACSKPDNIRVKGWFSYLLEDMIRPYQTCIISDRVAGLNFVTTNPHRRFDSATRRSYQIPGRKEFPIKGGVLNAKHFLTEGTNKAHSMYLAKLALRICELSGNPRMAGRKKFKIGLPLRRLENIYDAIYVDEVQDLAGYDYEIIKFLSRARDTDFICVGDFRQTIYKTSHARPTPRTSKDKINAFTDLGFAVVPMATSKRCVQSICGFADLIHADDGYDPIVSKVDENKMSDDYKSHLGIFAVRTHDVRAYVETFSPVILRQSITKNPDICAGRRCHNFGASKGLGFERTLILPTESQKKFLSGNCQAFSGSRTDESRNKFYVAVTRARYSTSFLYDGDCSAAGIQVWKPQ